MRPADWSTYKIPYTNNSSQFHTIYQNAQSKFSNDEVRALAMTSLAFKRVFDRNPTASLSDILNDPFRFFTSEDRGFLAQEGWNINPKTN